MEKSQAEQPGQGNGDAPELETYEAMVARRVAAVGPRKMTVPELKEEVWSFSPWDELSFGGEKLRVIAQALGITLMCEGESERNLRRRAEKQSLRLIRVPLFCLDPSMDGTYGFECTMVWGLPDLAAAQAWLSAQEEKIRSRYQRLFDSDYYGGGRAQG